MYEFNPHPGDRENRYESYLEKYYAKNLSPQDRQSLNTSDIEAVLNPQLLFAK